MKRYRDKHSPTTRKDSTVPSSYSVQQLKLSSLLSPLALSFPPLTLPRFLSLSLSLCHLTSSVSLVCLTDSKSPSLCPRSLCLPCQSLPPPSPIPPSPPPLLALSLSLSLLLASFLFPFLSLFMSVTHSLFLFPLPHAPSFSSTPSLLFCCYALACSSLLSLLQSSSSLTQIA